MAALSRYIVLIRGINVGGNRKLPMAQLREICSGLGCENVRTYIQSGNAVLDSRRTAAKLASSLEAAIEQSVGFAPAVIVRRADALAKALKANPYPDTEERFLHIGFMSKKPTSKAVASLDGLDLEPEGFHIDGLEIFLNFVAGVGTSKKLGKVPFERRLGVAITARNLRTVAKLVDLAAD